ncbi:MAG: DNA polymerase III subunit delta' [Paracoccaceae bacterium]
MRAVAADAPRNPAPEADRAPGAPHPRETPLLFGQQLAERDFLDAYGHGKLHHAWLITGPRGVGKATLAWRIARFLIARPQDQGAPNDLAIPDDHPVSHRIAALSEPHLFLLRRPYDDKTERLAQTIPVDEVRRLKAFFTLSATEGGRRVVIIDSADDLNTAATNALLKLLEEPPKGVVLLLISHQPSRLLPTIRSRCRLLRCAPLGAQDMQAAMTQAGAVVNDAEAAALAALAGGSVGEAIRIGNMDGIELYAEITALMDSLPRLDRPRALRLAESAAGRQNGERFDLMLGLFDTFLARLARSGAGLPPLVEAAPGETALMRRLSPDPHAGRIWAELQQNLSARTQQGRAVNLDPAALILDMLLRMNETAARVAA